MYHWNYLSRITTKMLYSEIFFFWFAGQQENTCNSAPLRIFFCFCVFTWLWYLWKMAAWQSWRRRNSAYPQNRYLISCDPLSVFWPFCCAAAQLSLEGANLWRWESWGKGCFLGPECCSFGKEADTQKLSPLEGFFFSFFLNNAFHLFPHPAETMLQHLCC